MGEHRELRIGDRVTRGKIDAGIIIGWMFDIGQIRAILSNGTWCDVCELERVHIDGNLEGRGL